MPIMPKLILFIAAANGFLAVIFGAFGAHALKGRLTDSLLAAYQTGVQYQFYHALALLAVGILLLKGWSSNLLLAAGVLFVLGIIFFSGSLYGIALSGPRWLGPITPMGGLLLILGWAMLMAALIRA